MVEKNTIDELIEVLKTKRTKLSDQDIDNLICQLLYQKELGSVYTEAVSNLVFKISTMKMSDL